MPADGVENSPHVGQGQCINQANLCRELDTVWKVVSGNWTTEEYAVI